MNSTQQTARVGLFFLLGIALVWVTFETLSDGKIFEPRSHTLIAGFDDLRQLKTGDEVRLAGVRVGSVQKARLPGRHAEAVLEIDPKVPIAGDATATIAMSGLIGGNDVAIDMGTPGAPALNVPSDSWSCLPSPPMSDMSVFRSGVVSVFISAPSASAGAPGVPMSIAT